MDNQNYVPAIRRGHVLRILLFLYDAIIVNLAYIIALLLRFSDSDSMRKTGVIYMQMLKRFAPWYTIACLILFLLFRMYSVVWRYAGVNDVKKLVTLNALTCVLYVGASLVTVGRMPISVYCLGAVLQFILMGVVRIAPRYILDNYGDTKAAGNAVKIPLMIVGLSENARIIQNKIMRDRTNIVQPVCVIDYAYGYQGNTFNGLPVYSGPNAVNDCIKKYDIKCVIIADNNIPEEFVESIREVCEINNIEMRDFVIGTEYRSVDVRLGELLSRVESPIIAAIDGEEKRYSDGQEAVQVFGESCIVDRISVRNDELFVDIRKNDAACDGNNEDWIHKYREEMGSDVSFF